MVMPIQPSFSFGVDFEFILTKEALGGLIAIRSLYAVDFFVQNQTSDTIIGYKEVVTTPASP
jgi:hypothetical protein